VAPPPASDPSAGMPAAARAAFAQLRRQFVAGLPARWQALEQAGAGAPQQAVLHRLAGAAGSYGYDALGLAARHAESLAVDGPAEDFRTALQSLRRLLDEAATVR
jgi:HPt (histidine-containing phosphotransfer) domain-containing protein